MTIQWGDTGKVAYGTSKTFTTTLATPRETLLGTPVSLPTTEPGTSQITLTVASGDLPTISPALPTSKVKYTALLYAAGKNTDASSQSVSWRVLKNSTSVATGTQTGIATNTFWTQGYFQFYDVSVGDVLEIRLWSTSTNVNYDYFAIVVLPTRMNLGSSYLNKDVSYSGFNAPTLVSGNPSVQVNQSYVFYPTDATNINITIAANLNFGGLRWNQTYFSGRVWMGDNSIQTYNTTHATYRPYYTRNQLPTTVTFREILR